MMSTVGGGFVPPPTSHSKSVPDQPERTCGESEDLIRVV
jgi:hypothetical protein